MRDKWRLVLAFGVLILAGCSAPAAPASIAPATASPNLSPALPTASEAPTSTPTAPPVTTATLLPPQATLTSTPFVLPTRILIPTVQLRGTPVNPSSSSNPLVGQARTDLAARLGIAPESIVVESLQTVEWPDSSLGCPQPGRTYAQVITPGVLILLRANGQTYEYHGSMRNVSLCEKKP